MTRRPTYQDPNDKKTWMKKDPNVKKPKWQEDPNDRMTQVTKWPKWQEEPSDKKTQLTKRLKWLEKPSDKMIKRPKWQKDPNDKKTQKEKRPKHRKTQVTRRYMWQKEWVAERLTDIMLSDRMVTDGNLPICWMSILKILKLCSLSNPEGNNTCPTSRNIPQ